MINLFERKTMDHFTVMSLYPSLWVNVRLSWPCHDTNLFPFLMEIMLKNTSYHKNKIITYEGRRGCIKTRSTSASFPPVTVKWTNVKFVLKSLLYATIKMQIKREHQPKVKGLLPLKKQNVCQFLVFPFFKCYYNKYACPSSNLNFYERTI